MNYLWEAVIKASEEEIPPDQLKFKMARRFSGYLELSNPYLNQESIKDLPDIEINPYYRFYHIFKNLCHPEQKNFPDLSQSLTNMIVHQLGQNDVLSGMSRKEYYKELLYQDFQNGDFGKEARSQLALFTREEREIILSGLLRQYETGSSLDIFKDMVQDLMDDSIVYQSNDHFYEIMVYIGQKENEKLRNKISLIIHLFAELPFHVEVYYQYHFGIMGVDCTMELDDMTLC